MTRLAKTIVYSFVSNYSVQCTTEGIEKGNQFYVLLNKGIIMEIKG